MALAEYRSGLYADGDSSLPNAESCVVSECQRIRGADTCVAVIAMAQHQMG